MTGKPIVSVLMPYRKKDDFFSLALKSLKNQTYKRLEILAEEDSNNEGLTVLLNRLAKKAKGEFLARMDADDISRPDRIEKQLKFLESNPDVMLVGSWATLIDETGKEIGLQTMPVSWDEIKEQAFFRNPFIHPSWMVRRKWFLGVVGYDEGYLYSQDWEFILRRVRIDRMENIAEPLVKLRLHPLSSSFSANKQQLYFGMKAQWSALRRGDVQIWKMIFLIPKLFSFLIPTGFKYLTRSKIFGTTIVAQDILGIVLPMGQSKKRLEESGQWGLWQEELKFYRKNFKDVEFFEYRYSDWRRYIEALLIPIVYKSRFRRCRVLKAVHLTGAIPCLISKLLYGTNYVLSYGYRYDKFAAVEKKWGGWLLTKILTPIAIKFASAVMVSTKELKNYVEELGAKRVEVIPNGVDTEVFKGPALPRQGRALSDIRILFVGRLEKQKNLETLIKATAKLDRELDLQLVGGGSQKQNLQNLAEKLKVRLVIKSPVENRLLPDVYRQADIFVLPSIVEGHPKALIEAMSCGLACLASNIPGVNEIITNGKNGLLVEPTAEGIWGGLQKLIYSPELRKRLGSAARKTVIEKFDKKRLMEKEISFLQSHFELVEKSRPDGHRDDLDR